MNFSSLKNITPLTFYFGSVICFVMANVIKAQSLPFYFVLLVLGLAFFFMGILKRLRTKR